MSMIHSFKRFTSKSVKKEVTISTIRLILTILNASEHDVNIIQASMLTMMCGLTLKSFSVSKKFNHGRAVYCAEVLGLSTPKQATQL